MNSFGVFYIITYVSMQLISNITSTKVGFVGNFAVDMGVFLYPLTFTLRDLVHRETGKKITTKCIWFSALMNLFMAFYLYFVSFFPGDPQSPASASFDTALSPVWRIVFASIIAQIVSELIDTEVYHLYVKRFKSRHKWGRVLISNTFSTPIDNIIFCLIAFAYSYPWSTILQIFTFGFIVKYLFSLISIPLIYIGKNDKS